MGETNLIGLENWVRFRELKVGTRGPTEEDVYYAG